MKKTIGVILSGIICLSLCSCDVEKTISEVSEQVTSQETVKKTFKIGENAEIDNVAITMTDVYESNGTAYLEPGDGNVFVICEFNIENNSNKEINISSMLNFDAYCDDSACEISITALSSNNDKKQLDGTVAAGKKMSGIVGYEVPVEWSSMEVRFSPDFWDNEEIIFVSEK